MNGAPGIFGYNGRPSHRTVNLLDEIAVDYGVHIVHDALERPGKYRISASTANAVMVDALTTILGFGALMVASHRGLESLGRLLTLGVTMCTLTSLVFLPAILGILRPGSPEMDDDQRDSDDAEVLAFPPLHDRRQAA